MSIEDATPAAQGRALQELVEFRFRLRQFLSFSEEHAEAAGITAQQYQLMQVVESAGPSGYSIAALAERLLLRHNSAVELVDRAERASLVARSSDIRDQRRSLVHLTAQGRAILERLVAAHLAYLSTAGAAILRSLAPLAEPGGEVGGEYGPSPGG